MKLAAPDRIASFSFDEVVYERDEKGEFDIVHPDHIAKAKIHGAHDLVAGVDYSSGPIPDDFGNADKLAAAAAEAARKEVVIGEKDDEIATLKAQIESLQTAAAVRQGTDTPGTGSDTSGDTSSGAGGTGETVDKLAVALAAKPNFDEMDRDAMVDWLASVEITIPGNTSKDNARKAIDDLVADFNKKA